MDLADDKSTLVLENHFGVFRHQAIMRANVDPALCRHIALLGHSELTMPDTGAVNTCAIKHAVYVVKCVDCL